MSIVCTIFEGHYHKGVAALSNSLYANGFRGVVWVGYKGALPPWAQIDSSEKGIEKMTVCEGMALHFVQFDKNAFLPYCKPDFMLDLLEKYQPQATKAFYFDCDIIVKCPFSYFEEWVEYGVALCEDVDSPISSSHPLRFQWADYFKKYNLTVNQKDNTYINGGFIGVKKTQKAFLETWQKVQNLMLEDMKEVKSIGVKDRTYRFFLTDQDALNIAKDMTSETLSIADANAMDFSNFGYIMSHAIGKQKPWQKNWLKNVFTIGHRPTMTDRLFLNHTQTPLSIYTSQELFVKKTHLKIASALARILT